MKEWRNTSWCQ